MQNVCTQGPSAQFSARVQRLGTGTAAKFWRGYLEEVCSHCCPAQNRARAPGVNTACQPISQAECTLRTIKIYVINELF